MMWTQTSEWMTPEEFDARGAARRENRSIGNPVSVAEVLFVAVVLAAIVAGLVLMTDWRTFS